MPELIRNGVVIDDTFAEAFGMRATAIVITADTIEWARQAALTMTGFATSVIASGCEAGIDCELDVAETPDARPGVRVLLFAIVDRHARGAAAIAPRPVRADLSRHGLLRRHGRRGDDQARRGDPLFRRRLADLETARRQALLAHPRDGRRVRLRGQDRA